MIELIFGFYGLIWWLIFVKFKLLKINTWSVMTSLLVAVATVSVAVQGCRRRGSRAGD